LVRNAILFVTRETAPFYAPCRTEPRKRCYALGCYPNRPFRPAQGKTSPALVDPDDYRQVKSLSPNHRLMIALLSPTGVDETGPPQCPSEKTSSKACRCGSVGHFSAADLREEVAELRRFSAILRRMQPGFSAVQTEWRRERDSNPRSSFVALSLDVSVSCRQHYASREFTSRFSLNTLQSVRFGFAVRSQASRRRTGDCGAESGEGEIGESTCISRRSARFTEIAEQISFAYGKLHPAFGE
jgi:hypothetical protein